MDSKLFVNIGKKVRRGKKKKKGTCNNASGKTEFLLRSYPDLSGSFFDSSHIAAL